MARLLIVSSTVHPELSAKQLQHCLDIVNCSPYEYQVEQINAGSYELPFVINHYHKEKPFDGYLALGLILKKNLDHYHYIMNHISTCFSQFALQQMIIGNGIISGSSVEELHANLGSHDPCLSGYRSAFNAVDFLINFTKNSNDNASVKAQ